MKQSSKTNKFLAMALGCSLFFSANANNAVDELFDLLDNGSCTASSLTGNIWTVSTNPGNSHGELLLGDTLEFDLIGLAIGATNKGTIQVSRNGLVWTSANGWSGECISNGTITQFVISGEVDVNGCLHDVAFGRLDHDDNLSDKLEITLMDNSSGHGGSCSHPSYRHPGHTHGDGG